MAIPEIWTIAGPAAGTLASLGIERASLRYAAAAADTLDLELPGDLAAAAGGWTYGAAATLSRAGTVVFRGQVASLSRAGAPAEEGRTIRLEGPWANLGRLVYAESAPHFVGAVTASPPHPSAALGKGPGVKDGTSDTSLALQQVLAYAEGKGAGIAAGTLPPGRRVPLIEATSRSCEDIIRQILRWHWDCLVWVDYSTAPARLHVVPADSAAVATITGAGRQSLDLTLREDLVPTNVVVSWEATVDDPAATMEGGDPDLRRRLIIHQESAGGTGIGLGTLAVVMPVTLDEASAQPKVHSQAIVTRPIPRDGETGEAAELWWIDHSPLRRLGLKPNDLVLPAVDAGDIRAHKLQLIDETTAPATGLPLPEMALPSATGIADEDDRPKWWTDNLDRLPRELVDGTIQDWMRRKMGTVRATATMGIRPSAMAALPQAGRDELTRLGVELRTFGGASYQILQLAAKVRATDAITRVYKQAVPTDGGESEPVSEQIIPGLAAAIWDAVKEPHWEGRIALAAQDAGSQRWMGRVIRATDLLGEWASMRARPQSEAWDLAGGGTTIQVGPPSHLSPQDFAELMRAARAPRDRRGNDAGTATFDPAAKRRSGRETDRNAVIGAGSGPIRVDETLSAAAGRALKWELAAAEEGEQWTVNLEAGHLIDGAARVEGIANTPWTPLAARTVVLQMKFNESLAVLTGDTDGPRVLLLATEGLKVHEAAPPVDDEPSYWAEYYRLPLWRLTATEPEDGSEARQIAEEIWATRLVADAHLHLYHAWPTVEGDVISSVVALEGGRL